MMVFMVVNELEVLSPSLWYLSLFSKANQADDTPARASSRLLALILFFCFVIPCYLIFYQESVIRLYKGAIA
jgi:hypothetical protein